VTDEERYREAGYLWGKIQAVESVMFALFQQALDRETIAGASLQALDNLRTAALNLPVPEGFLDGIAEVELRVQRAAVAAPPGAAPSPGPPDRR
jgi:hypothetical protein